MLNGKYIGQDTVVVSALVTGYFDIKDFRGTVLAQGIHYKYMRLLQHNSGYVYAIN